MAVRIRSGYRFIANHVRSGDPQKYPVIAPKQVFPKGLSMLTTIVLRNLCSEKLRNSRSTNSTASSSSNEGYNAMCLLLHPDVLYQDQFLVDNTEFTPADAIQCGLFYSQFQCWFYMLEYYFVDNNIISTFLSAAMPRLNKFIMDPKRFFFITETTSLDTLRGILSENCI